MSTTGDAGRTAHTPGPWKDCEEAAIDYRPCYIVGADGQSTVAILHGGGPKRAISKAEERANARLIAAAPDLFECAEILEKAEEAHANCDECEGEGAPELCVKCFPLFDDARVKRRAALAAAKGAK